MQRAVDGRQQQRQRAAAGAVGHEHADAAPVEVGTAASCSRTNAADLLARRAPRRARRSAPRRGAALRSRRLRHGLPPSLRAAAIAEAGRLRHYTAHDRHRRAARAAPGPAAARRARRAGDRAAAVRRGARAAGDLAARARRPAAAARRRAVPRPGEPARDARPLRDPAAARQRRGARRARRRRRARSSEARVARGLAALCAHWDVFRGTPVRFWLEAELAEIFGVARAAVGRRRPTRSTTSSPSGSPQDAYRPRALLRAVPASRSSPRPTTRATTSPRTPRSPPTRPGPGRVIPTFRPDRYLEPAQPGWPDAVARLGEVSGVDTGDYAGLRGARWRRAAGTSSPTARRRPTTATRTCAPTRSSRPRPTRIYRAALAGDGHGGRGGGVPPAHAARDGADVVRGRARDDAAPRRAPRPPRADGGARSGPTPATTSRSGSSSPTRCARCSSASARIPGFHLVLFTLDETVWSRELAPLAGFYPSVYVGAPWWFLDAPEAIRRFRARGDRDRGLLAHLRLRRRHARVLLDPRPPRHVAPRSTPAVLAELVAEHRLDEDEAVETAVDLVTGRPTAVFKL